MTAVGLLPAIRDGIGALARTGQQTRLIDGYLRPYARAFGAVRYFSYLDETLAAYTTDAELLKSVELHPGRWHPWLWTLAMPFLRADAMRGCAALRVFQVTGALPAVIARRRWGVPFVTTYGFWYARLARNTGTRALRLAVERLALASADAVIVTTEALGEHVARRVPRDRIHRVPNGVDTALFVPRPRPEASELRVLYVGRLSDEKNLDALVQAATRLGGRVPVSLTFVGDGPARARLEALASRDGVALRVRPFVEHARLPEILAAADVFALPSLTEGHPKALIEAMSVGLPSVASAVGGVLAILEHERTGLLVPPADAPALAAGLERLWKDRPLAARLGAAARERAVADFDLGRLVATEIALVRAVAAGASPAGG